MQLWTRLIIFTRLGMLGRVFVAMDLSRLNKCFLYVFNRSKSTANSEMRRVFQQSIKTDSDTNRQTSVIRTPDYFLKSQRVRTIEVGLYRF